jgi:hypothetical protein
MARSFSGSSAGFTGNQPAILAGYPGDLTLSVWTYLNATGTTSSGHWAGMIGAAFANRGIGVQAYGVFGSSTNWGGIFRGINWVDSGETLSLNQWHHLVFVHNSGTGNQFTYRDGSAKATAALGGYNSAIAGDLVNVGHNDANNNYFADFAMWTVMLSGAEITSLANGVRPKRIRTPSLIVWYPMDGIESPEADLSGNHLTGTLAGTTGLVAGPPFQPQTSRWPQLPPFTFIPQISVSYQRAQQILMTGP